ncbi:cytochrome-c peroxidase [Gammaproteobacteria bacterium LSUCC0112]|nr:cytochrome-c peroxidase [Gammaproteobacteria bacterium LSUCC0112]
MAAVNINGTGPYFAGDVYVLGSAFGDSPVYINKLVPLLSELESVRVSVSKTLELPDTPFDYANLSLPSYFVTNTRGQNLPTSINGTDNTPADNPITNDGATLGRVLFYDTELSANGTISCASCHQQDKGFSDDAVLSAGFLGGKTARHSMTLINARFYQRGRFFWDERAATLEEQVLMPFQDPVEMGMTLEHVISRVSAQPFYAALFEKAFGSPDINADRIAKALAQFVRSIVSYASKYDAGRALSPTPGANFSNFTAQENLGKNLFFQTIPNGGGACFGCHTTEAFISANPGTQNNGLDAVSITDLGAGAIFSNSIFVGRFKTSSLRNVELTAPYMHDGRFATLEEVVEHYNSGIQNHPTLSPALQDNNGNPVRLNLTETEKAALVAFLKTLTDPSVATEEKWSNPFRAL